MQRRTRRNASTIGGAAPDTIIGRAAAHRAGARPYRPHVAKTRRNAPRRAQHVHKEAQSLRRTFQEPDFSILRQRALVGTRSRAIRRRTSKEGANVKTGGANWKSLISDSAKRVRRSSKKKRRDMQRRTRGSASLPAPTERLGPIISTIQPPLQIGHPARLPGSGLDDPNSLNT